MHSCQFYKIAQNLIKWLDFSHCYHFFSICNLFVAILGAFLKNCKKYFLNGLIFSIAPIFSCKIIATYFSHSCQFFKIAQNLLKWLDFFHCYHFLKNLQLICRHFGCQFEKLQAIFFQWVDFFHWCPFSLGKIIAAYFSHDCQFLKIAQNLIKCLDFLHCCHFFL